MTRNADKHPTSLIAAIETEFQFLVDRGFRGVAEDENSVRYDGPGGIFVRIFRDSRDKYVGYRIGLTSRPRDALTSTELAKLSGVAAPRGEYPERADQLHSSVARVARELRVYGERALAGDESIYDDAMELRRAYTQQFTREDQARPPEPGS